MPAVIPRGDSATTVSVDGEPVIVVRTRSVVRKRADRSRAPVLELELSSTCLVKKISPADGC